MLFLLSLSFQPNFTSGLLQVIYCDLETWCDRQQLWKAVITGDTVTRLIIPIRGRGKSPEEGQRWNLAETQWKKKQHKNYQDVDKKFAINKKVFLRLRSLISKWFQLKTIKRYIYIYIFCFKYFNSILRSSWKNVFAFLYIYWSVDRVFANGLWNQGSIQDRVIPTTQKWYVITPCLTLSIIRYGSRVSGAIKGNE